MKQRRLCAAAHRGIIIMKEKCIFTGKGTTKNFRGIPVHDDALVAARVVRDKIGGVTLKYILRNWKMFKSQILKEMASRNSEWAAEAFPNTFVKHKSVYDNKRFIAPHSPILDRR